MDERGAGWIMYAWICLVIVGVWNIIEGVLAIGNAHFYSVNGAHYVISNLNTWGWIVTIWGVVELLAAASIWRAASSGAGSASSSRASPSSCSSSIFQSIRSGP